MAADFLKFNGDKTELVLISNPKRLANTNHYEVSVCSLKTKPPPCPGSLGVRCDYELSFKAFIQRLLPCHIRSLAANSDGLPSDLVNPLCTSFVISCLEFCKVILTGLPKCSLRPLQLAFNVLARSFFLPS